PQRCDLDREGALRRSARRRHPGHRHADPVHEPARLRGDRVQLVLDDPDRDVPGRDRYRAGPDPYPRTADVLTMTRPVVSQAHRPDRTGRAGFSLVELIVAVIILAIGVLGLAGTTAFVIRQVTLADVNTERSAALQMVVENLRATSYN